ncbi:MAG: hypothetical protein P8Q23_08770 [Paracoccaceae bacterium]|nr:hypothetical protein [Paracoccaceae bacterium]
MIRGLPASIIAHAAVLGMTYVSLPYFGTRIYVEPVQAVAVEFAELGEINNIAPTIEPQEEEAVAEEIPEEIASRMSDFFAKDTIQMEAAE